MIDYSFFRNIPIKDVLDALGIQVTRHGKFVCPAHNDKSPSASINPKKVNTWHCFSCNAGGSAIDLIMEYDRNSDVNRACRRLDELGFTGGIIDTDKSPLKTSFLKPPTLSEQDKKAIGLKINPFASVTVMSILSECSENTKLERISYSIIAKEDAPEFFDSIIDANEIIIAKIMEHIADIISYKTRIFKNFPLLDSNARAYITETTESAVHYYRELMQEFTKYGELINAIRSQHMGELAVDQIYGQIKEEISGGLDR